MDAPGALRTFKGPQAIFIILLKHCLCIVLASALTVGNAASDPVWVKAMTPDCPLGQMTRLGMLWFAPAEPHQRQRSWAERHTHQSSLEGIPGSAGKRHLLLSQERPQKSREITGCESEQAKPGELDYK